MSNSSKSEGWTGWRRDVVAVVTTDLAEAAGRFGYLLHAAGVPVTAERSARFAMALEVALPATNRDLYWTARVTLLSDHGQAEVFDRVFSQVFEGMIDVAEARGQAGDPDVRMQPGEPRPADDRGRSEELPASPSPIPGMNATDSPGEADDDGEEREVVLAAVSDEERLRTTDFSELSAAEHARLRHLMQQLSVGTVRKPARRLVRHARGTRVDLRATLARAHRTGGDPVRTVRRRRSTRPRQLVLLCDISGSMEPYARAYLQLLHSAVGSASAEAFVFSTRLTRITRSLRVWHPDVALRQAAAAAPDWSSGTRIGAAIKRFLDDHGRRGMARGAVVVIVSDGWERDDPALLGAQMERLSRLANRVIWVNPRRAHPRYEPLVGGMKAALPYVDVFVSGHTMAALDEVIDAISRARLRVTD